MKKKIIQVAISLVIIIVSLGILPIFDLFNFGIKDNKKHTEDVVEVKNQAQDINDTNSLLIEKNLEFLKDNIDILNKTINSDVNNSEAPNKDVQVIDNNDTKTDGQISLTDEIDVKNVQTKTDASDNRSGCIRNAPQLAIIIDDVATMQQYKNIQTIPFKVTPSIFPRSEATPNTPNIARIAPFFMVHLPLEALSFYQKGHKWLFVNDTKEKIKNTIQEIRDDFPNLKYINNHTGSKFTQDYMALSRLLDVLRDNDITFVDSRTTSKSQTKIYYQNHKMESFNGCQSVFLQRDIFLDNELDVSKITQNIITSIELAKKRGYAIAIGHPHKETILALKNAKEYILKSGVEMVYINELVIK